MHVPDTKRVSMHRLHSCLAHLRKPGEILFPDCLRQQPPHTSSGKRNSSTPSFPAASSFLRSYTLTQRKAMENEQLVVSIIGVAEPEGGGGGRSKGKEGKEESAEVAESWIAASAAPWPECKGFRGMLFVQKC